MSEPDYRMKREIVEDVPCGQCVTTQYYDDAWKLIRQDVKIIVSKPPLVKMDNGKTA